MSENKECEKKECIYGLMNGLYDRDSVSFQGSAMVENEFEDGKPCTVLYQEVYDANRRLCSRLGVDEDRDIENLISNMQEIAKILAMKMFDYGMQFQNDTAHEMDSVAGHMKET